MPFTRDERKIVEAIIKNLGKAIIRIQELETEIVLLKGGEVASDSDPYNSIAFKQAVEELIRKNNGGSAGIIKHNHKSDEQGGPAFAKLGANLISN